jgi:hypothetical protein
MNQGSAWLGKLPGAQCSPVGWSREEELLSASLIVEKLIIGVSFGTCLKERE